MRNGSVAWQSRPNQLSRKQIKPENNDCNGFLGVFSFFSDFLLRTRNPANASPSPIRNKAKEGQKKSLVEVLDRLGEMLLGGFVRLGWERIVDALDPSLRLEC